MRIALLADLHLPDRTDTVKEPVFSWALREAAARRADLLVGAGDMTGLGTLPAARRYLSALQATGIPFLYAPGNADLRTAGDAEAVATLLSANRQIGPVVVLDNAWGAFSEASRAFLDGLAAEGRRGLFAVAHCPLSSLGDADANWMRAHVSAGTVACFASGHTHADDHDPQFPVVRGLDPDKAIGGPPALVFFSDDGEGRWFREDVPCPLADPGQWPTEDRASFLDFLGISGMYDPMGALEAATTHHVPSLELRYDGFLEQNAGSVLDRLRLWRDAGGKSLSLHLPSLGRDEGDGILGAERLLAASRLAVQLGVQAATMHVPEHFPAGRVRDALRERLLLVYAEGLAPLRDAGAAIGIENMHLSPKEKEGDERGYGYTPPECRAWIDALRQRMGYDGVGFHLDIGHARNNGWYASRYNLSEWYAELGGLVTGCHLHQVVKLPSGFGNHYPLDELYGRFISLSSFLMAWRTGQLRHAPLYLEIREAPPIESLLALRRALAI